MRARKPSNTSPLRVMIEGGQLPLYSNAKVDLVLWDDQSRKHTVLALTRQAIAVWSGHQASPSSISSNMLLKNLSDDTTRLVALVLATLNPHASEIGFNAATFRTAVRNGNLQTVMDVYSCALKGCGLSFDA